MLAHGSVDAIGILEPTLELAIESIGSSTALLYQNATVYREMCSLYTTAEKLKNPAIRKDIVAYLRAPTKQRSFLPTIPTLLPPSFLRI